jgi:uncharacterized protein (TIGR02147 family)
MLRARDYREFLALCFEALKAKNKGMSYSLLARRAGFSARSYTREIMTGKKPVTTKSFDALASALTLSKDAAAYLRLLLALEIDAFNPKQFSRAEIEGLLRRQRSKIEKRSENRKLRPKNGDAFGIEDWPLVFASLGSWESGVSLSEISTRTGLAISHCELMLREMINHEIVHHEVISGRYIPKNQHLLFEKLAADKRLQDFFLRDLRKLQTRASERFDRADHLFFDSTFSILEERLAELRKVLWSTLVEFVDDQEDSTGGKIVTLLAALVPAVPVPHR